MYTVEFSTLKDLRVAAIMDTFTYECFAPECNVLQLTPQGWEKEINDFSPHMFFIESAWQGKDKLWWQMLTSKLHGNPLTELTGICCYCKKNKIPIVFWCKEDPAHFRRFFDLAKLADFVFTSDADVVPKYKCLLYHNRVYWLPFAAQPKLHNPIEEYDRVDGFCFAGAYYPDYSEREKFLKSVVDLKGDKPLSIYARLNYLGEYGYPDYLAKYILGTLSYNEISKAYKGYKYGINLTSMFYSGYMFARRVFELMASGTVCIGNYCRGIRLMLGELAIITNSQDVLKEKMALLSSGEYYAKYALKGLREVYQYHLYEHRLDFIISNVFGKSLKLKLPTIEVIAFAVDEKAKQRINGMFLKQTYSDKLLTFILEDSQMPAEELTGEFITIFNADDYYGENYLLDFALSRRFADDACVGKLAYYTFYGDDFACVFPEKTYTRKDEKIDLTRQMIAKAALPHGMPIRSILDYQSEMTILGLDRFNYCAGFKGAACQTVDDLKLNTGTDINTLYQYVSAKSNGINIQEIFHFPLLEIAESVDSEKFPSVVLSEYDDENGCFAVDCTQPDDSVTWIRSKLFDIESIVCGRLINMISDADIAGNAIFQLEFYDSEQSKINWLNYPFNQYIEAMPPSNARFFLLVFRFMGNASVRLRSMTAFGLDKRQPMLFPLSEKIIIVNKYLSYELQDACRWLHILAKKQNIEVVVVNDVMEHYPYREYEGVQISQGGYDLIDAYLYSSIVKCVILHEPDERILNKISQWSGEIQYAKDLMKDD